MIQVDDEADSAMVAKIDEFYKFYHEESSDYSEYYPEFLDDWITWVEWVTDSPFVNSPIITFEVSGRLLGGLMALGYTIATILKRKSHVFSDGRVSVKLDWLEQLNRQYVQALPDDLKTKLGPGEDMVSSPKEALSKVIADRIPLSKTQTRKLLLVNAMLFAFPRILGIRNHKMKWCKKLNMYSVDYLMFNIVKYQIILMTRLLDKESSFIDLITFYQRN